MKVIISERDGLTKLLYRIDGETIFMVDMWDVRQEPPSVVR